MTESATPQVITVGETMAMVTSTRAEPLRNAADFRVDAGGAESNVASHLAALGVSVAWVGALGEDALGLRVFDTISARGVDARWVIFDPEARTGVYFKDPGHGILYYRDRSAASRMGPHTLAGIPLEDAGIVHLSGITPALSPTCAALVTAAADRVRQSPALLSFDVNHRPALWADRPTAAAALRAIAAQADIVFTGLDEAHDLWGCRTAYDVRTVLPDPGLLVVKNAGTDATEFDNRTGQDAITTTPANHVAVIEPVGAGDAFAAGYLAALLRNADAAQRLNDGHRRAALVLSSPTDFALEQPCTPAPTVAQACRPPESHPAR